MTLIDHFKTMLKYETWANQASLASIETVPAPARSGMPFTRALQVMAHNQLARRVWLARLQGRTETVPDWFPSWPLAEIAAAAAELDALWAAYVAGLTEADLERTASYRSSDGVAFSSKVHEVLAHVANHSTYHRGQVARLVSEAGGRRASTDLIAMTRTSSVRSSETPG